MGACFQQAKREQVRILRSALGHIPVCSGAEFAIMLRRTERSVKHERCTKKLGAERL